MVKVITDCGMNDQELLTEYSRSRSDAAFALIVERYIRLVHRACWRQLADAQLAEDATQMVFVLLSQKAGTLRHAELSGWLLTTARYTCANLKRAQTRRVRRETQVVAMSTADIFASPDSDLLKLLDEGLLGLGAEDREALVARFFRDEPLAQVGEALGLTADAARKRVERALVKLRGFFQERGVATDSAALAVVLGDQSHVPAIGSDLAPRIVHAAKIGPVAKAAAIPTKLAAGVLIAAVLGAAGWGFFRRAAEQQVAASTSAPAMAAAVAPAVAAPAEPVPATMPASDVAVLDRTTPDNTLASIAHALSAGDRKGLESCLVMNVNGPRTLIEVSMDVGLANSRIALAAKKAYGDDGYNMFQNRISFPATLEAIVLMRRLQGESADITGDTATITTEIPAAIMQAAPYDAQQLFLTWSGKPIYFVRRDGGWLLDLNRSIHFLMKLQKKPNSPLVQTSDAENSAFLNAQAAALDTVREQLEQGQFAQLADFQKALSVQRDRVLKQYHVYGV